MDILSESGNANYKLSMPCEVRDAFFFFSQKKQEKTEDIFLELNCVDSLLWMFKLTRRLDKVKDAIAIHANVKTFNHNFGDYVLYKSLGLRSTYLEN